MNALKHGLSAETAVIPGEDPAAYEALADSYQDLYEPDNPATRFLVDTLLRADWQKQRLQRLEAGLIRAVLAETPGSTLLDVMLATSPAAKLLARTQRQIAAHERAWFRAHRELVRLAANVAANQDDTFERYLDHIAPEPRPGQRLYPSFETAEPGDAENSELPERTQFAAAPAANTARREGSPS